MGYSTVVVGAPIGRHENASDDMEGPRRRLGGASLLIGRAGGRGLALQGPFDKQAALGAFVRAGCGQASAFAPVRLATSGFNTSASRRGPPRLV